MKFWVVGNRRGQPVIHWPGAVLSAAIISGVYSVPIAAFYWGVGFLDRASFALLSVLIFAITGTANVRGLNRPLAELPAVA